MIPINETVKELPLNLEVGPISMTKWQLFLQIDQSFQIHRSYGSMLEGEADELKVLLISFTLGYFVQFACNKFSFFFFFAMLPTVLIFNSILVSLIKKLLFKCWGVHKIKIRCDLYYI